MRSCIFYTVQKYGFRPPSDPLVTASTARPIRRARRNLSRFFIGSLDASTPIYKVDLPHFKAASTPPPPTIRILKIPTQTTDSGHPPQGAAGFGAFFSVGQRTFWRFRWGVFLFFSLARAGAYLSIQTNFPSISMYPVFLFFITRAKFPMNPS
jgi:hypothetical protein